jgi:hypothetical protein
VKGLSFCLVGGLTVLSAMSHAQEGSVGQQSCINQFGSIFCPPPNGTAIRPLMGDVVCGHGQCVKDAMGQIYCLKQTWGLRLQGRYGSDYLHWWLRN